MKKKAGESDAEGSDNEPGPGGAPGAPKPPLPKAPAVGGMAGTHDPNYQTLAAVGGDMFGADKKAGAGPAPPKPPAAGGMAGERLNFQRTAKESILLFFNNAAVAVIRVFQGAKAGTFDPNYQTLAGIGGDVFGADKKAAGGGDKKPMAPANQVCKFSPLGYLIEECNVFLGCRPRTDREITLHRSDEPIPLLELTYSRF
ncbi:hypothetical protein ANCCEY_05388 [Ancylostoma ceylanicum]|uniref:Uncharacterized protein n=1 Tax=Ancylostoma ceylanicum TaxID=53326 RepID=A0A0D6M6L2_9BILA|nr:hypothetical protein ANCCEY_05388 [Ancylostoma ceylanicum]